MKEPKLKDSRLCIRCGKEFTVLRPDVWTFRRCAKNGKTRWYCTWTCFRAEELEEEGRREMKKLTLENKKKAVEIALEGGNPNEYLKACGVANPSASWMYIKKTLQEKDPKKYAQLTNAAKAGKAEESMDTKEEARAEERAPELKIDGAITLKTEKPEKIEIVPEGSNRTEPEEKPAPAAIRHITRPMVYDGLTVRAVSGKYGRYTYKPEMIWSDNEASIEFESNGGDKMKMSPDEWRGIMTEMKKAAAVLGVGME